jgi:quinol monooxygenase YgiN
MIRLLIERRLAEGSEERLRNAMRDLRREALHVPGYVSGETHRDLDDPRHFVVIATWRSREAWEAWSRSDKRRAIEDQIRPLLEEPEKVTVLEPA